MAENILLVKLGAIGDVLRTTSILKPLKEKYHDSKIVWLTKKSSKDVLENNPLIDKVILTEDTAKASLLGMQFSLVINLDEDKEICSLVNGVARKTIGFYIDGDKVLPTQSAKRWYDMSAIGLYPMNNILKKANKKTYQEILYEIVGLEGRAEEPILMLTNQEIDFGKSFLAKNNIQNKLTIGINTGAGKRWQYKKWGVEDTSVLIDRINNSYDVNIILLGGPEESDRNEDIRKSAKTRLYYSGTNNSIKEFSSIINICDLVITSDSLAMHIAIALKKKIVVFFGPTSSAEIEIYERGEKIVSPIECVCCYLQTCEKKPTCMDKITVEMMYDAVDRVIKNYSGNAKF